MTEITESDVRNIADLARLELDREEARGLAGELERILGHFREIDELDLEPAEGPGFPEVPLRLRSDVPGPDPMARGPDEIAPDWRGGLFVVPRVASMAPDQGR